MFARLLGTGLAASLSLLMGCSLILDPTYCESDSECEIGVCTNGVCVGRPDDRTTQDMSAPDADISQDGTVAADATVIESDAGGEPIEDAAVDSAVDARMISPPSCTITAETDLTNQPDVEVIVEVIDEDDTPESLTVTVAGEAVSLNRQFRYRGYVSLQEGSTDIELVVRDQDGQLCEQALTVVSDRTPPVIEMLEPVNGVDVLTNAQQLTVRGRVTEENFENELFVRVDGVSFEPVPPVEWVDQTFLFTVPLNQGDYRIELFVRDTVGNESGLVDFSVEVDTEPPIVRLEAPVEGAVLEVTQRRFVVRGSVEDGGRVVRNPRVAITVTSGDESREYDMPAAGVDGSFSQAVQLFNGQNTINICGLDDAGNEHCVSGQVTKNAPCISVDSPVDGAFVGSLLVTMTGSVCAGVVGVSASINGGEPVAGNVEGDRFSVSIRAPRTGEYDFLVVARTDEGETAEAELSVSIDTTRPTLSVFEPEEGVCVSGSVEVRGQAQDDRSGIARIQINGADVDAANIDLGGGFRQVVPVLDGEAVDLRVVAVNGAGLETTRTTVVRGDSVAPVARFDILNPIMPVNPWLKPNGAGRIRLTGRVDFGTCGLIQNGMSIDDRPVDVQANRFEHEREYGHGPQSVHWILTDIAGNVSEGDYGFRVDSQAPLIGVETPADESFTSADSVTLSAVIDEVGSGLRGVRVNGAVANVIELPGSNRIEFEVSNLVEGPNPIVIQATDQVGNVGELTLTVYRDVTPVEVTVNYPQPGVYIPVPAMVTGTATDGPNGSGVGPITVNGVVANYDPLDGTWIAYGVEVSPESPEVTVQVSDQVGNSPDNPLVVQVNVGHFGVQERALDGIESASHTSVIRVSDLNFDTLTDVVALSGDADGESIIFVQNQFGQFTARDSNTSGVPAGVAVQDAQMADFDADGSADILIVGDGATHLLAGSGNGSFRGGQFALPGLTGPVSVAVLDMNRDLRQDILLQGQDETRLYFGDQETDFAPEEPADYGLDALVAYTRARPLDVDQDGDIDLVAVGEPGLELMLADREDFNFSGEATSLDDHSADASSDVVYFDANNDGTLDALVYGVGTGRIFFGAQDSAGFDSSEAVAFQATDRVVAAADFDGDGRDDLMLGGDDGLSLLVNGPDGFTESDAALPYSGAVRSLLAHDIDTDGDFDLLIGADDGLHLLRSNTKQLNPDAGHIHLQVVRYRLAPLDFQPADAVGVIVYSELVSAEDMEDDQLAARPFQRQRALVPQAAERSLITLGDQAGARLRVDYIDIGGRGGNSRSFLSGLESGRDVTSYARE